MIEPTSATPIKATLIDITKCIGCRSCQIACKQWNDREGEETQLDYNLGFQNPATLSAKTLTLITYHELPDEKAPGGLHYLFTMRRCLHCLEPACASACPTTALERRSDGHLRSQSVYRLPLLHLGMPMGRANGRMGFTFSENSEVHTLRGPLRSTSSVEPQRTGTERRRKPTIP